MTDIDPDARVVVVRVVLHVGGDTRTDEELRDAVEAAVDVNVGGWPTVDVDLEQASS